MTKNNKLWLLSGCNGLIAGGYALSMPFFAVYLATAYKLPLSWVGAFLSASMLVTAVSQAMGGEVSDSIGRKKMMLLALFSRAVFILGISAAVYFHLHYIWIFVCHFLSGITGTLYTPAADAWIADNIAPRNRISAFGKMRIGLNLGWALGPLAGGFLTGKSYPMAFALTGISYLITGLIVLYAISEKDDGGCNRSANFREMIYELKNRRFAEFCFYATLIAVVMSQLVVGLSLFGIKYRGFTQSQIGLLFSINGFMVVALQHPIGKFLERYRITSGLLAGSLLYAAGYLVIGYSTVFAALVAGTIVFSLGEIAVTPGLSAIAANIAPAGHKGRSALGIFMGGTGLEYLCPYWLEGPWVLISMTALAAGAGFYTLRRRLTRIEDGLTDRDLGEEKHLDLSGT